MTGIFCIMRIIKHGKMDTKFFAVCANWRRFYCNGKIVIKGLPNFYLARNFTTYPGSMKSALHFGCVLSLIAIIDAQVLLNSAATYAVLAGTTIADIGLSQLFGDIGVAPGLVVTGFGPGTVSGVTNINNAAALQAKTDALAAYTVSRVL